MLLARLVYKRPATAVVDVIACLLVLRQVSCHLGRCPVERASWQGTERGLWPTVSEELKLWIQ